MSDEDEYDWPVEPHTVGSAQPAHDGEDEDEYMAGTLWLPDPESRRGWSMRHVWRKKPQAERRMGFRR